MDIHTDRQLWENNMPPPPFWGDIISTKTLLDNYSLFVVKLSSTFIYVIAGTKEVIYFLNVFPEDLEIPTTMTVSVYISTNRCASILSDFQ